MKTSLFMGLLLMGLILLVACSKEPGRHLPLTTAEPLKLGLTTVSSQIIDSPHTYTDLTSGRTAMVQLGNPGPTPVTVLLEGAKTQSITLPPGSWTHLRAPLTAETLSLTWPGGPLRTGSLYLQGTQQTQPNVLLVSVDTLRADHFNAEHMPETFAVMSQGQLFDRAYTPTPWTLPAHVSLLTGQYPARHGVRLPDQQIPPEITTLAEVFSDAGYTTLAVTEGNYVSGTFGFTQGFGQFTENAPSMLDRNPASISKLEANLGHLLKGMAALNNTPRFVFLHTYEVHCPYLPRNGLTDTAGMGQTQWLLDNDGKPLEPGAYQTLAQLYKGEVAWLDRQLAPLLKELLATGRWIIALTSDHGEEFGEHGGLLHADTLYEETTHIPMALAGPGIPTGRTDHLVSLVDLPGTLLHLAGLTQPESWQSRNIMDPAMPQAGLFAESFYFGPQIPTEDPRIAAVWLARDKLIQTRNFDQLQAELYQLAGDPAEQHNQQQNQQQRRDTLYLLLTRYLSGKSLDATAIGELTPEQIETMRSLGYIK